MKRVVCSSKLLLPTVALLLACGSSNKTSGTHAVMKMDAAVGGAAGKAADASSGVGKVAVTVTGPVTGGMGKPWSTSVVDLASHGYVETEFLFGGDATAYALQGDMTMDGKWQLMETTQEPFKSRMMVRRPVDASKFNGTVVIEWLNVSGGADGDPGYMYNFEEILREGYAWVGVSAQAQGVVGGGFSLLGANTPPPLTQWDPERYGSLVHPGDAYSFDIYTRAAQVVRGAGGVDVLDGLKPKRLIAYGESQSAIRLVSYVDGVHPLVKAFDGFFIHSRGGSGVPFDNSAMLGFGGTPVLIRDDIKELVFQFQTETDVLGMLAFFPARQPDSDRLRTWEVAGTAHADTHILEVNQDNNAVPSTSRITCDGANNGPQHFVIKAALHALNLWMTDGTAPVKGDLLTADKDGKPVTDDDGNALGGIRTPDVDVPISTLSGQPAAGSSDLVCSVFGHTTPFTPEKLMALYPTHDDYVMKVKDSAAKTREAKFILEPEEQTMVAKAEAAPVPQ